MNTENSNSSNGYIKMDYTLTTTEERKNRVNEIIANTPSEKLTPIYLTKLADYLIDSTMDKQERLQNKILTDEHMKTVNKREFSFEGLITKLENGEDGIYNMIANDKNIIFSPKVGITKEDIETIPGMRELVDEISRLEKISEGARGRHAYALKKQIIEMRQDQYVLKAAYRKPIRFTNIKKSSSLLDLAENVTVSNDIVTSTALLNLFTPAHISLLLCNYSRLKEECWDRFTSDMHWMMEDLDNLVDNTFEDNSLYKDLIIYKIDGKSNAEIQNLLAIKHGVRHSVEYISSLWRNKIPKMIAETAVKEYLIWHYTFKERGKWKRCSRCGQIKLANNYFFSKNNTSKDGWYSICKDCRNNKTKKILPKGE